MRLFTIMAIALLAYSVSSRAAEEEHGHKAVHGGCLNEIGACENGHAEVKVEGGTLRLWFVDGGKNTDKSVRVPDKEIKLTVTLEKGQATKELTLTAKPLELAEEKLGDCSYFEGKAEWLKDIKKFGASGKVAFKGKLLDLKIEYPDGFDPDHAPDAGQK